MNIRDKILIVEDERSITNFLRTILTSNDYDVIIARSGAEAYSMITSHCPDLIVLDLGLPDIDGLQIIKSVREWTLLPIVVVSARAQEREHPPQDRKKSGRASVYIHRDRRGLQNGRGRLIIYPGFTKIHPDCGIISIYRSFFNQKGW